MNASITQTSDGWLFSNKRYSFTVKRDTGEMSGFSFNNLKPVQEIFTDYDAQVDDLAAVFALPVTRTQLICPDPGLVGGAVAMEWDDSAMKRNPARLRLTRRFGKSPLVFITQWSLYADYAELEYVIEGFPREMNKPGIALDFPLPGKGQWGWAGGYSCWAPLLSAPFEGMYHSKVFHHPGFIYAEDAIPIGLVSVYERERDVGLSFAIPVEDRITAEIAVYQRKFLTRITLSNEANPQAGKAVYRLCLSGHEGCWRPGLKWFSEKWREYFEPENKEIWKSDGSYLYSYPSPSEKYIRYLVEKMNLKWVEVCFHEMFGNFAPVEKEWISRTLIKPSQPETVMSINWDLLRDHTAMLKRNGVYPFAYFFLYDCEHELAERCYADSIVRNSKGEYQKGVLCWDGKMHGWIMNPSPRLSYGQSLIKQARRLFDELPDITGLFMDNNCFGGYDFAHHDGFTFVNGKPAFDLTLAYDELHEEIQKIIAEYGKMSWGNCASTLRRTRHIGGIMSEGNPEGLGKLMYFCVRKPVMILSNTEKAAQLALKCGGQIAVKPAFHFVNKPDPGIDPENEQLYDAYLPMLKLLSGRKILLHPNALTLPLAKGNIPERKGIFDSELLDGNIFELVNGDYGVTLLNMERSALDEKGGFRKDIPLIVRLPDADKIKKFAVLGAEYRGYHEVTITKREKDALHLNVPLHGAASLVVLMKEKSRILNEIRKLK